MGAVVSHGPSPTSNSGQWRLWPVWWRWRWAGQKQVQIPDGLWDSRSSRSGQNLGKGTGVV